jgi:hypothetical protein
MHSWITFGARMNHEHTRIHETHHSLDQGEAITFPLIIFFVPSHGGYIQMSFCPGTIKLGVLKFSKLGLSKLWKPITFCEDLQLRWGIKQSCNTHQKVFNDMWHATYTHLFLGDYWLLMVESQFGTLIPGPSFNHNLCFKHSNGSCKPIFNIYVLKTFQWYK